MLESQTLQLKGQHDEALARAADLESKLAIPSVPLDQFEEAMRAKADSEEKLRASLTDIENRDKEIAALAAVLAVVLAAVLLADLVAPQVPGSQRLAFSSHSS